MLCSNGFELYFRCLPLVSVWLRSKKRGTRVKNRVKNGAHIVVGTPTKSLLAFSHFLAGKNFLFEFSMYLAVTTYILSA